MTRIQRGWGGVAAMAAACALALAAAFTPLSGIPLSGIPLGHILLGGDGAAARITAAVPAPGTSGPLAQARDASAPQKDTCTTPEASLNPSSGTLDGPAVRHIKQRGRLVVGVDQNSYLWGFRDPASGKITGFDIDIVKAIARNILGDASKVQYLTVPTAQRISMIQRHKVDMVVRTMTINCERIKEVAFSTAYFEAGQQILAPRGSSITGFDDSLKGKTVCTASGSTGLAKLRQGAHGAHVVTEANQLDCLVLLQLDKADAVFTDNALAAGQAAQDPSVHLVGTPVTQEPYGVAMNLADSDLVRRVNQVLNAYRAGGAHSAWMRSYHTWLSTDLPGIAGPPPPKYK